MDDYTITSVSCQFCAIELHRVGKEDVKSHKVEFISPPLMSKPATLKHWWEDTATLKDHMLINSKHGTIRGLESTTCSFNGEHLCIFFRTFILEPDWLSPPCPGKGNKNRPVFKWQFYNRPITKGSWPKILSDENILVLESPTKMYIFTYQTNS